MYGGWRWEQPKLLTRICALSSPALLSASKLKMLPVGSQRLNCYANNSPSTSTARWPPTRCFYRWPPAKYEWRVEALRDFSEVRVTSCDFVDRIGRFYSRSP